MRRLAFLLLRTLLGASALAVIAIALLAILPVPTTAFMIEASISRRERVSYDWTTDVSPQLLIAVVAAEDQRFDQHSGFDFAAIENAAKHNQRGGSVRGASTISQQVAKNLLLWPGRSWLRKGLEAAITVVIETLWSKRRILEVYVNVAEMGDGLFGAESAARRFFGKHASQLSASEAALLAAVLPNPTGYDAANPSPYLRRRQQWILRQMQALGGVGWLARLQ